MYLSKCLHIFTYRYMQCERKIVRDDRIVPMVSATASRDKAGVIHISLSNVDLEESQYITLSLDGVQVKSVSGRILTSKNIDDCNSFEHPDIVTPKDFKKFRCYIYL